MTVVSSENPTDDGICLWSKLLEDVKDNTSMKLPPQRLLLIMGDEESGKTTLTSYLHGNDDLKKSYSLEYQYVEIKDEYHDEQTKLSTYTLGGNVYLTNLLKFALNETNFGEAMAVIVVSMHEPWSIIDSLQTWYDVLASHCARLRIDPSQREEYQLSLVRYFQEYVEPLYQSSDDSHQVSQGPLLTSRRHTNPLHPTQSSALPHSTALNGTPTSPITDTNQDKITLPLPEGVLNHNLGVPITVIVTKTDLMDSLAKEHNLTEEHFDVIQMHIRKFCLARGAALIYTSVKEEKNCDILKGYLKNRIYGLPFTQSAYVVEKDCVFVPTGWDNLKKIKILEENLSALKGKTKFNECIPRPIRSRPSNKDVDVMATEEQKFLETLNRELEKNSTRYVASSDLDHHTKKSPSNRPTAASHVTAMKTKSTYPTAANVSKDGEGVLANFFNSLLKKTNSPGQPGTMTGPLSTTASISMQQDNDTVTEANGASLTEKEKSLDVES